MQKKFLRFHSPAAACVTCHILVELRVHFERDSMKSVCRYKRLLPAGVVTPTLYILDALYPGSYSRIGGSTQLTLRFLLNSVIRHFRPNSSPCVSLVQPTWRNSSHCALLDTAIRSNDSRCEIVNALR